jgi:hypothetical protein
MNPSQIKQLLSAAESGQLEALRIVDRVFEQIIFEGSESDLEQAVQMIGNFLSGAAMVVSVPRAA